jgi:hypothetical protein
VTVLRSSLLLSSSSRTQWDRSKADDVKQHTTNLAPSLLETITKLLPAARHRVPTPQYVRGPGRHRPGTLLLIPMVPILLCCIPYMGHTPPVRQGPVFFVL